MDQDRGKTDQKTQPTKPDPPRDVKPAIPAQKVSDRDSQEKRALDKGILIQSAIAIFTAIMAGTSIWQGIMTRESNKLTRESNETTRRVVAESSRAWVGLVEGTREDLEGDKVGLRFKNSGQSPAFIEHYQLQRTIVLGRISGPPELLPDTDVALGVGGTILPGESSIFGKSANPITPKQWASIKDGSSTICVLGIVEYKDRFGSGKFTRFCLYWEPEVSTWVACPHGLEMK